MGKQYPVSDFAEVKSLPPGYNSVSPACQVSPRIDQFELNCELQVVFDRLNGRLNESVIYNDAAIRPVFLIIFATWRASMAEIFLFTIKDYLHFGNPDI